jgi:hypothetical protein
MEIAPPVSGISAPQDAQIITHIARELRLGAAPHSLRAVQLHSIRHQRQARFPPQNKLPGSCPYS